MTTRWFRLMENKIFFGVCTGIAKELQMDVWIIRLIFILSVLWFGTGIGLYLALILVMPRENTLVREKLFLGACSRISKRYQFDIVITRLLAILSIVSSFGLFFVAYFLVYFFMPKN